MHSERGARDLGYIEGRNIILEFRLAGGNLALGPQLATELAALPVDVIVTEGLVDAAVAASGYIPIVAPAVMDPVQRGFASSLAQPDRNFTGFTLMHAELNAKRLDLLRKSLPHITAVAALVDPANPAYKLAFEQTETAARLMGWEALSGPRLGAAPPCASCDRPSSWEPTPWS